MPGYKLLYIIQVKRFSWPYLISNILVAYNYSYNAVSDWPRTFLQPLFSISVTVAKLLMEGIPLMFSNITYV